MPYVGEIRLTAFGFTPVNWQACDGSVLQIGQYPDLFFTIKNIYGGDGIKTFAVPDLRGRTPIGAGGRWGLASAGGVETVTLVPSDMGNHTHAILTMNGNSVSPDPAGNTFTGASNKPYSADAPNSLTGPVLTPSPGGGQAHQNRCPSYAVNYIIALFGDSI